MPWIKRWSCTLLLVLGCALHSDDATAEKMYAEAYQEYQKKEYHDAFKKFEGVVIEAKDPVIKANAVRSQIAASQMCGLYYQEFLAIERLLKDFPEFADFTGLVKREFEIAELFYQGFREPMYWSLRWIPWLTDTDHTVEIFQTALKRAPFAPEASRALLRLAQMLDRDGKTMESLKPLRELVRNHPKSKEYRYGLLGLANALCILATHGDGDARYNTEAAEVLNRYLAQFPKTQEEVWVRRQLLILRDIQAQRLLKIAEFYRKDRRSEAAKRYLTEVIQTYPDALPAEEAERQLVELDKNYLPDDFRRDPVMRQPKLASYPLPPEASKVLVSPPMSDNKYIQPVYELKSEEPPAEK